MGAGAMTICHNKAAVKVREDMLKMVQIPILKPRSTTNNQLRVFGKSLTELQEQGLLKDGVPQIVRKMVEHIRTHGLDQEGLFRVNGSVRAVDSLKQRLTDGEDVDFTSECDVSTVASLLKLFLRELPHGLISSTVQKALIRCYQDCGDSGSCAEIRNVLQLLPDVHLGLLRYLCHFLTQVEHNQKENRMTAHNLATVFGASVFHVAAGFEAIKDQTVCNKIMVQLIQNYNTIFEAEKDNSVDNYPTLITVKAAKITPFANEETKDLATTEASKPRPRKLKVKKGTHSDAAAAHVFPKPGRRAAEPLARPLPVLPLNRSPETEGELKLQRCSQSNVPNYFSPDTSSSNSMDSVRSCRNENGDNHRPISPFYRSPLVSPQHHTSEAVNYLKGTIRSTVQQHLFGVNPRRDQRLEVRDLNPCPKGQIAATTARERRRSQKQQDPHTQSLRHCDRSRAASAGTETNKENVQLSRGNSCGAVLVEIAGERSLEEQISRAKKWRRSPTPLLLGDKQDAHVVTYERSSTYMEAYRKRNDTAPDNTPSPSVTLRMKIQESPVACDTGRTGVGGGPDPDCEKSGCEDVPRLDLTALSEDSSWGESTFKNPPFLDFKSIFYSRCDEPVPAYPLLQRESMDREEARLSPHCGGRLIRQLLEEDSDPMVSPRFYAYGHGQQYLDDTEVPPSPPNAHSFISRRRSSSLGSCDDDKEELTSAQLTKRIHVLKKKIHRFEERFEEDRKYRPSHSDKAANPEVLRWVTELAKLRKMLKEHRLIKSEEDLPPVTRQRSNTLPKSFGSQLEKKPQQEKSPKPPVDITLESIQKKLQEKRNEVSRPEDIKDMTREQIAAEKVALQKALLYYESIHGRPVTKNERQIMKPLYDRYRLVKQILCRASTIPVIGSPSNKRRGPLLQPIIEGETALFFDDIKEEEDGSEDDADTKTQFTVTVKPDLSMLGFIDRIDEDVDGFISPVDELSPSKNTADMGLSNLHSATIEELVEQLQETREEKKRIRKNLKEFEDQFFRQNGRNVQKEDRSPLAVEYGEYKHVKAKLRLLEVLISKRDSSKFI